jgi:hypothetical protein
MELEMKLERGPKLSPCVKHYLEARPKRALHAEGKPDQELRAAGNRERQKYTTDGG